MSLPTPDSSQSARMMSSGQQPRAHIELLGHVAIRSQRGHTTISGRPATVLATLALCGGPVSVSRLVDILWSNPPEKEVNALQRHISRLRSVMAEHGAPGVITHAGGAYELEREHVSIDVDQLASAPESERDADGPSFPARWWLEPLATVDHVDFIAERRRLERLCRSARTRALASVDASAQRQSAAVPVEVVRELRRWLELRPRCDEAGEVVKNWLAEVDGPLARAG